MILFVSVLAGVCYHAGCRSAKNSPNGDGMQKAVYHSISAEQAKSMMDNGHPYVLLDVRTESEFREIRISGAILIPDNEIRRRAKTELPDKDILILVYCRSGRRSANAAQELASMGYTNVCDFGGIIDWPYETISGQDK